MNFNEAERAGFEPASGFKPATAFPVLLLQPLGHLSMSPHVNPPGSRIPRGSVNRRHRRDNYMTNVKRSALTQSSISPKSRGITCVFAAPTRYRDCPSFGPV